MVLSWSIEAIIYYLIFIDAVGANITVNCCEVWYKKTFRGWITRHFPVGRGWTFLYLLLVLWIGWALTRLGVLTF